VTKKHLDVTLTNYFANDHTARQQENVSLKYFAEKKAHRPSIDNT